MANHFAKKLLLVASSAFLLAGCSEDNSEFQTPSNTVNANSGIVSQNNFSLLTANINPGVIDGTTGVFTRTEVELTAYIGDRNNQKLSDAHTVFFVTEYGLIEPSCVTEDGSCSVTWTAIKRPDAGRPGSDGAVTITAYTIGEESFTDTNGNGLFDDGDAGFDDLEEPYVDVDESGIYNTGDIIIDTVSTNDPSGQNGAHDIADGFFNGGGCTHSVLCGVRTSTTIFDQVSMNITVNVPQPRTIGGTVTGLTGTGLVLQNNGADDLSITANGDFVFSATVDDGNNYAVTVQTNPTGPVQVCTASKASGTVNAADVTDVAISCI